MEAQQIVVRLRDAGLSQSEIGQAIGITQGAVSAIERGKRNDVRSRTLEALRALLDTMREVGQREATNA
ncbi:hypothetical protein LMG1866_02818 [Achromobacter ruhlandii]|uniref:helix-turn-helix domain-containing protein n=1 Tax=Achromobacter ruhlandii TaxID=72557 RepID=UPI00146876EC|nr:helix-turn-helix domain-containing protein [Achromobacter ruhlandii]CAB3705934.1 hypothetical protein LMG1866_02818 [Achromobacter ruhlandii]